MKFKYSVASNFDGQPLLDSRGKSVKRPIVWLELKGQNGAVITVPAIIDSGADTTTVNIQYAKFLGVPLDPTKKKEIMGISSGRVAVHSGSFKFGIKELGTNLEVPAWYIDSGNVNILLGQEVFFDTFRIKFEKDHDTFEIAMSNRK